MPGVYLDCVLDRDYNPVKNAQPHEVLEWLQGRTLPDNYMVCIGRTLEFLSVQEYLARSEKWKTP